MDGVVVNIDRCAQGESITVDFTSRGVGRLNRLPITDGWSYTVRLYRLRAEILQATWVFPAVADGWPPP